MSDSTPFTSRTENHQPNPNWVSVRRPLPVGIMVTTLESEIRRTGPLISGDSFLVSKDLDTELGSTRSRLNEREPSLQSQGTRTIPVTVLNRIENRTSKGTTVSLTAVRYVYGVSTRPWGPSSRTVSLDLGPCRTIFQYCNTSRDSRSRTHRERVPLFVFTDQVQLTSN